MTRAKKGSMIPCGLCGHGISMATARRDPRYGRVCSDGRGCKRRRGRKRTTEMESQRASSD